MPGPESGGTNSSMFYSFDQGLAHFIALNTETDFPGAPENIFNGLPFGGFGDQVAWLRRDLIKANASRHLTPWIIVSIHRPWYASSLRQDLCIACQSAFESLLNEYRVDLVIQAHKHWYERTWPIGLNATITANHYNSPSAPVYIVNGAAGHFRGLEAPDVAIQAYTAMVDPGVHLNYGVINVNGYESLTWTVYAAIDLNHSIAAPFVLDTMIINKPSTALPPSSLSSSPSSSLPISSSLVSSSSAVSSPEPSSSSLIIIIASIAVIIVIVFILLIAYRQWSFHAYGEFRMPSSAVCADLWTTLCNTLPCCVANKRYNKSASKLGDYDATDDDDLRGSSTSYKPMNGQRLL